MDAPQDSNLIPTPPFSSSEDSNVFNYMSELSPLKPDKPVHHTQESLFSMNLWSPPPVFSSPHVSYPKELRMLPSDAPFSDALQPNESFERGLQISSGDEEVTVPYANHAHVHHDSSEPQENNTDSGGNALVEQLSLKCTLDIPEAPICDYRSSGYDETNSIDRGLFLPASEMVEQGGNWESLATPNLMQNSLDPTNMPELPQNTFRYSDTVHSLHETRCHTSELEVAAEIEQMQNNLFNFAVIANNLNERMDNEHVSGTHHRMLRRSLDYGMAGMQRKDLGGISNTISCRSQSLQWNVPNDKWLVPKTVNVNSLMSFLPGNGPRLNGPATLEDSGIMNNGWPSTNLSNSAPSMHPSTRQQLDQMSSMYALPQRDLQSQYIWNQPAVDYSQPSPLIIGTDFNQNRSNRKRRKLKPAGEGEGCKHCKCKNTNCLKLYCECFASGFYCTGPCSCQNCSNKPIHKDIVLATRKEIESRDPLAFAPKVIRNADSLPEAGVDPNKTPASTRHRRGCSCQRSGCQKKYCECYQNGVGCSIRCRCGGCKNTYGRNNSKLVDQSCEMLKAEKVAHINEGDPNSAASFQTPSRPNRSRAPASSSLRRKQHSNFIIPDDSEFHASQRPNNEIILHNQSRFEYNFQSNPELEMPKIHQVGDDSSSITCINNTYNRVSEIFYHPSPPFPSTNLYQ